MGHLAFLLTFLVLTRFLHANRKTTSLEKRSGPSPKIAVNARGGNAAKSILFRHEISAE
jgi:hypothetical protein